MEDGRREAHNWNPDSNDQQSDDNDSDDDAFVKSIGDIGFTAVPTKTLATTPRTKAATQRRTVSLGAHTAHKRQQERRSPKPPTGKRKASAVPLEPSPADTSAQAGEPRWKKEIETQLEDCAQERKKRRVDYDGVQVRENSLKMAIRVRMLDQWDGAMLEHLANDWDLQASTLQTYLDGNPKNLLFKETVRELNDKFGEYLAGIQVAAADMQQPPPTSDSN